VFYSSFFISSAVIPFLAGIPVRIGYRKNARSFLLTHSYPARDDYKGKSPVAFLCRSRRTVLPQDLRGKNLGLEIPEASSRRFSASLRPWFKGAASWVWRPGEYGLPSAGPDRLAHADLEGAPETASTVVITGMPSTGRAAQFLKDSTGDRVIDATGGSVPQGICALLRCGGFCV